jgi:glyoxylase I family protein
MIRPASSCITTAAAATGGCGARVGLESGPLASPKVRRTVALSVQNGTTASNVAEPPWVAASPRDDYVMTERDVEARHEDLRRTYLRSEHERSESTARGVHHLALICRDPERTIRFYQNLLGLPLVGLFENRDYPGSTHFFFDIGNDNLLAFFDFPGLGLGPSVEAIGGVQHIALSVTPESFEAAKQNLEAEGIEYLGPDRGVTDSIYFRDPDGIQIELTSQPLRAGLE